MIVTASLGLVRIHTGIRWALASLVVSYLPASLLAQPKKPEVDFSRDVRPILSDKCFACHGPDENARKADLRLDTRAGATVGGDTAAVVPGKPEASTLIERITSHEPSELMPPAKTGKKLTPREMEILRQWVKEGAPYAMHWAYVKPARPAVPAVKHATRVRNPIDNFILYRLEQDGRAPAPEADRYTLIRRVSLDLTGLPPTWEEVDAFVKDQTPNAYEKLVDRLLAKPAFGEHLARSWLDLARYADSAGYADDPARTIWKYRDYVIQSFNANKPFDQFTIEQLAGDLLLNPTDEQLTATAFHRNTMTNNEGGTNDEEFRNVAIVDRVNTTMTVWMGTSIACCQCHTHKYDPITQTEYFQLFAIFNNTADADRRDESPLLNFWEPKQLAQRATREQQITALEAILGKAKPSAFPADREALALLKKKLAAMKPATTVPILRELPANQHRKTRLQHRGNFMDLGEEVHAGVPATFPPLPNGTPANRLSFAKWLVSPENPMTARVLANRYWERIFGIGLVRTSEEFGAQGEQPSHPELLDWLALELTNADHKARAGSAWNIKAFLKLMVMSNTYRQSAKVTPEMFERDPDNRFLERGPRVRLTAEMIRDQSLFVAGLLSPKMLGPSVRPPQPNLGVNAAFGGSIDWKPSTGEDRYRRGIYTLWRRSNPYPSMATFDAPNRDICTVRRARTNTPLQALVTMNDPVYMEAAQSLAKRGREFPARETAPKIEYLFRLCLSRPASAEEVKRLVKLYDAAKSTLAKDLPRAQQLAGPLPKGTDTADAAAMTVVASVLLNLDEMLFKR